MDLQFYGANCLSLTSKQVRLVVDDNLIELGARGVTKEGDVCLFSGTHAEPKVPTRLIIDQPGEYEVSGLSIFGIAARGHMDADDQMTATMYKIVLDDLEILITGHIYPELSDSQLETIGTVDVMFVPVGGNGYALDGLDALKLIKKIDPRLIIPTHYDDKALSLPVPQQTLDQALKALAMEPKETVSKLRLKAEELGEATQLVVLERS